MTELTLREKVQVKRDLVALHAKEIEKRYAEAYRLQQEIAEIIDTPEYKAEFWSPDE